MADVRGDPGPAQRLDGAAPGESGGLAGALLGSGPQPGGRWAARDRLVRIEQLVAACKAHGGRAGTQDDPLLAHLVIPHAGPQEDEEVVYVAVHTGNCNSWSTEPRAPDDGHLLPRHAQPAERPR